MAEPKWTPGPWEVEQRAADERWIMAGDILVAVAYLNDPEDQEGHANASLIAAAPDLYEACRVALRAINANSVLTKKEEKAREMLQRAILKARGEPHE